MATIFRAPVYSNRPVEKPQDPHVSQNLLLTVLAVAVVAAPFSQTAWPNPSTTKVIQPAFEQNLLTTTLFPAEDIFRHATQTKIFNIERQQPWIAPNLLTTTLFVPQDPFYQTDWQNPAKQIITQADYTQNLLVTTLLPVEEVPEAVDVIRNFSLKSWRKWLKYEPEIKLETEKAVKKAIRASKAVVQGADESLMLLQAMEARQAYEDIYRQAFQDAYIEDVVAEMWKADMLQMRNRMAIILLLLDQ